MRYLQWTSLIVLAAFSSKAYGMLPEEESSNTKSFLSKPLEFSSEDSPKNIMNFLLMHDNLPKHISIDGISLTHRALLQALQGKFFMY